MWYHLFPFGSRAVWSQCDPICLKAWNNLIQLNERPALCVCFAAASSSSHPPCWTYSSACRILQKTLPCTFIIILSWKQVNVFIQNIKMWWLFTAEVCLAPRSVPGNGWLKNVEGSSGDPSPDILSQLSVINSLGVFSAGIFSLFNCT